MTQWVEIGTDTLRDARHRLGLSYESAARLVPVSSKTWERWEKRGQVPRPHLYRVAEALGLELEWEEPEPVPVSAVQSKQDRLSAIERELRDLRQAVEALLAERKEKRDE